MAMRTITRLFDTRDHAMAAVRDLEAAGFRHEDVSILANNAEGQRSDVATAPGGRAGDHTDTAENAESGTGIGATLGTVLGGYLVLAVNVLILLLLTSQETRTWSRRTAWERWSRRGGLMGSPR